MAKRDLRNWNPFEDLQFESSAEWRPKLDDEMSVVVGLVAGRANGKTRIAGVNADNELMVNDSAVGGAVFGSPSIINSDDTVLHTHDVGNSSYLAKLFLIHAILNDVYDDVNHALQTTVV